MTQSRPHVVIAGGGVAGVETLLALRELAGARVSIELLAPEPELVMRPMSVAAPFGAAEIKRYSLADICADQDVHLRRDALTYVDTARRRVETRHGTSIAYDALVLAVGARPRPALLGALTFDGPPAVEPFRALLEEIVEGDVRSIAFAVPEDVTWTLALYELVLMTSAAVAEQDVRLVVVTPEEEPLGVLGAEAARVLRAQLADRGVELHTGSVPLRVTRDFVLTSTGAVRADRVVALPLLEGPRVPGVPANDHGFLPVDEHCAVVEDVYAAGDGTDAPLKQGGLATQQADAAAEAIAAAVGAPCTPTPFRPVLRAALLTGALPWFFRGESASNAPMWWPASKVAARYLAPYLADRTHARLSGDDRLRDTPAHEAHAEQLEAARELALMLGDDAAAAGEHEQALRWLDAAEAVTGTLPEDYLARRRRWQDPGAGDRPRVRRLGGEWTDTPAPHSS